MSHKEDADGISAAALIRQAFGGQTVLTDYPGQMEAIEEVASDPRLKALYICDLGLSKKTQDRFVELMTGLRKRRVSVAYIDHHDIDPAVARRLVRGGTKLVHDTNECATVQVYSTYKARLGEHAPFVAACAAITDYMEDRPVGARLLQTYDRQFALFNATLLTYNIVGHQKDDDHLHKLVAELAASKYPHEIPGSFESARAPVEKLAEIIVKVRRGLKKMSNIGHMEIMDAGAGGAVNFVLGLSGKDVGVAYRERTDRGIYAVSVRGSRQCKTHLGRIVNTLAADLGGSGGGHDRACGAVIPKPQIQAFLRRLDKSLR